MSVPTSAARTSAGRGVLAVAGAATQMKLPVMIHQGEAHSIEPAGLSRHVARHRGIFGKMDGRVHLDTGHAQNNSVRIRGKAARNLEIRIRTPDSTTIPTVSACNP